MAAHTNAGRTRRLRHTARVREIVAAMSLEEKVALMSGNLTPAELAAALLSPDHHYNDVPLPAGGNERLGVAPVLFCDGPRGVVCGTGRNTCFPAPILRAATFDPALEQRIGRAMGAETRAAGGNLLAAACVNLAYHPGWGRSQESYGEESDHLGRMGAALVRGIESAGIMACVKHFALYSRELSRFQGNVSADLRTEREVYLPHFEDCIAAGASAVMTAFTAYQGVPCGHHEYLLRRVLKGEWGFDGLTMSDFGLGIHDTEAAANAGLDIEMCATHYYGPRLVRAVREGRVPEAYVDEAALRIVRTVLAHSGAAQPPPASDAAAHAALALRAAREGITLLQNRDATLPFSRRAVRRIALLGRLGARANTGDDGSSRVYPAHVVTPLEGLGRVAPGVEVICYGGHDLEHARHVAAAADAVVFVVGLDAYDEGEYVGAPPPGADVVAGSRPTGGDRVAGLGLPPADVALIEAAGPANPRSAVVLMGGGTLLLDDWRQRVGAILMAYYPGQEGGTAIAEVLLGDVNPSGKLPFVVPCRESDLPAVDWSAPEQYYGYYHGYAYLEKAGIAPRLPFGYGLSYTTFCLAEPHFAVEAGRVVARCTVANTGRRAGSEVVQLYVGFRHSRVDRPVKLLRGCARVHLAPGRQRSVTLSCPLERLRWYDPAAGRWELEHMPYEVYIGTSSADADLLQGTVMI